MSVLQGIGVVAEEEAALVEDEELGDVRPAAEGEAEGFRDPACGPLHLDLQDPQVRRLVHEREEAELPAGHRDDRDVGERGLHEDEIGVRHAQVLEDAPRRLRDEGAHRREHAGAHAAPDVPGHREPVRVGDDRAPHPAGPSPELEENLLELVLERGLLSRRDGFVRVLDLTARHGSLLRAGPRTTPPREHAIRPDGRSPAAASATASAVAARSGTARDSQRRWTQGTRR